MAEEGLKIRIVFGVRSTSLLEREVLDIVERLSPEECIDFEILRDRGRNAAIAVYTDTGSFLGPTAMVFLRGLVDMDSFARTDRARRPQRFERDPEEFTRPDVRSHLAKRIVTPFAQVSETAPTIGHHYQYVARSYLPEENMGHYDKVTPYSLTRHFPIRRNILHADGRTRLPTIP